MATITLTDHQVMSCPQCGAGGTYTVYTGTHTVCGEDGAQRTEYLSSGFGFECLWCDYSAGMAPEA